MYQDNNNNYNNTGSYSSDYQQYGYETYTDLEKRSYGNDNNNNDRNNRKKKAGKLFLYFLLMILFVGAGSFAGFMIGSQRGSKTPEIQQAQLPFVEEKKQGETTPAIQEETAQIQTNETVRAVITDVTDVVAVVMPSVVSITNTSVVTQSFWGQEFVSENDYSGSGFIVGENENELLIVTNNHVITDSTELKVQFIDETVAVAKIKGTDRSMDLAVLSVSLDQLETKTKEAISIAVLGDSEGLKVGEPAIAIGNALGYGQSVTTGVISALDRQIMVEDGATISSLIQTDAAINPGNSGGALLNVKGEVVGINSNKMGGSAIEGMGYAIPISKAKPIIEELMSRETRDKVAEERKGYLGISGLDVTSEVSAMYGMPLGVYVAQVYDGGAGKAGMMKGDIITAFDGNKVSSMEELQGCLEYYEIGSTVLVTVQRPTAGGYIEHNLLVGLTAQVQTP